MQQITILGNIGQDAELRNIDDKRSVISFSVACSESWKNKKGEKETRTTWYDVAVWDKPNLQPFLKKGGKILVQGTPRAQAYLPSNKTEPVGKIAITATSIHFAGIHFDGDSKKETDQPRTQTADHQQSEGVFVPTTGDDDGLPF